VACSERPLQAIVGNLGSDKCGISEQIGKCLMGPKKRKKMNFLAPGLKPLRLPHAETNVKQKRRHRTSSKPDNPVLEFNYVPA